MRRMDSSLKYQREFNQFSVQIITIKDDLLDCTFLRLTEGDFTDDLDDSMKENINPISRKITSLSELNEPKASTKKVPLSDITKDMAFSDMDVSKLKESFAPLKLMADEKSNFANAEEQLLGKDNGRSR
jgi:hypothetical protein